MAQPKTIVALTGIALGMLCAAPAAPGRQRTRLGAPATDQEIASLIRSLGDPAFAARTAATRRLTAIGGPALDRLRTAADDADVEMALRARAILSALDGRMLMGVDVHLAFSAAKVEWDQPVELVVTMTNRSPHPARVPFEIDETRRRGMPADARQVGDLLDLADHLLVRTDAGRRLELTVDDIRADADVEAAVNDRLDGGPTTLIEPGETATLRVAAFNRGWARYRLLDARTYSVRFEYVPEWADDELAAQRIGRVVSNEAELVLTRGAPETVSRRGSEAAIALHRSGGVLIARLTNRADLPTWVNLNFGGSLPFASGAWVYELDDSRHKVPFVSGENASWDGFEATRLVQLAPGATTELATIDLDELRRRLKAAGADLDSPRGSVHFAYTNLCDRQWQAKQGSALLGHPKAPPALKRRLPRRILYGGFTSGRTASEELHPGG